MSVAVVGGIGSIRVDVCGGPTRVTAPMPTYLALHKHRKEGAQTIKQLPERLDRATQLAHSMDCDVEYYLTNGQYDSAVIVDAPDERTAKQLALGVTSTGTVTTEFQRAFHESEIGELTDGIPEP